jgi:hypothetical protein
MNSSPENPKLPTWAFLLTDVILVAAAWFIGGHSAQPLSWQATVAIVGCIFGGLIVGLVPLVVRFERQKNETLDDRQRALESLARTVAESAEQISIAAAGLNGVAELAQKNLRHAEQLPHKLQDKIAEFQAQLTNANDAEKEEMEKELTALRSSESERLDSVSDKITRATADWTKLETATHQHLTAATEAIAKLSRGTADAIGKAQAAAEQALAHARTEAARGIGEAAGQAAKSIETAKAAALSELATKFDAGVAQLDERIARLEAAANKVHAPAPAHPVPDVPVAADTAEPKPEPAAPKRQRKPRPEPEPAGAEPTATAAPESAVVSPAPLDVAPEPTPFTIDKIAEVTAVAPSTAEPFSRHMADSGSAEPPTNGATETAVEAAPPPAESTKPARKRPAKKATPEPEPALGLAIDDPSGADSGVVERVLTSDGATRLLVTAYIGIGNRLFIRGQGPGLAWDKGVPLQFVSIGKWRWESNDATGPVRFKLLKNDELECVTLGEQKLDPGYQQEVTAAFN